MNLPEPFIEKMHGLLGPEAEEFFSTLTQASKVSGLRINTLKASPDAVSSRLDIPLSPVPWCGTGFYYPSDTINRPSKSPLYKAGLYYLQEPSAMSSAVFLDAGPGDKVLDLCAAPGGKTTQIAAQLQGKGLLVANDASASRSRALIKNLTLCGVRNAVVLQEMPKRLSTRFPNFFDKILVDAPCSGEGMFRKDPDAVKGWTANKPEACVLLQREILHHAAVMLKPGGRMVYSTCTFDIRENEALIDSFLGGNPEFAAEPIDHKKWGFSEGFDPVKQAARLWPHKIKGEGHFLCVLCKKSGDTNEGTVTPRQKKHTAAAKLFNQFCQEHLKVKISGPFECHGRYLYAVPECIPDLSGLRIGRSGWHTGEIKKDRFEPSHALALGLTRSDAIASYDLSPEECDRYLKGESLEKKLPFDHKSWVLLCVSGYPLGWARLVNGRLKNKYPQGWI